METRLILPAGPEAESNGHAVMGNGHCPVLATEVGLVKVMIPPHAPIHAQTRQKPFGVRNQDAAIA